MSSYKPMRLLDPVLEEPEVEDSEADVEFGKADTCASPADETLSFLRWKLRGEPEPHKNYNPARLLSRKGAGHLLNEICTKAPWVINMILMIAVVVLALRLNSKPSAPGLPPTDVMYSECTYVYRLEVSA